MAETLSFETGEVNPDDTIKILVASDIHLGYKEKDPIRADDSFIAFEEVLQHALVNEVDAILLCGNLFDVAIPSTNTLDRCSRLLKTYTLGDKPIKLEFLGHQNENFVDSLTHTVNYEDPNMNIAIPVFSIHGDHEDSFGVGRINSMNLLSTIGYVNYCGKWTDPNNITIRPIMLRKGETKLALYGLSYMDDARLCRLLEDAKVHLEKPVEPGFFSMMVLHQNRVERGRKNHLPECALPQFLDLIIWGREHDCRIEPQENTTKKFYISQPGSTVATSLSESDVEPKCCGLLSIHKRLFRMDPIPLKSVRPFVFESVDLDTVQEELALEEGDVKQKVQDFATKRIEAMIAQASTQLNGYPRQPKLPLIRLHLGLVNVEQQFNAMRFAHRYNGRVANPLDMIIFDKKSVQLPEDMTIFDKKSVQLPEDIVESYFLKADAPNRLDVFHPRSMTEMCHRIVAYDDVDIIGQVKHFYKDKATAFLCSHGGSTEESMLEALAGFQIVEKDLHAEFLRTLDPQPTRDDATDPLNRDADGNAGLVGEAVKKATARPASGRGSRGGRRSQGGRAGSKAASTSTTRSKSQTSTSAIFGQPSGSKSSKANRMTTRQMAAQKARQMVSDSDDE